MENNYQRDYDLIISKLEKDFRTEIELIDELYLKHKENYKGGFITQAIKDELNHEREDFLSKWSWKVPIAIFNSIWHRKEYLKKCSEYCHKVYHYPFEIIDL